MSKVEFDEANHRYTIEGAEYPSVTHIVRFLSYDQAKNADPMLALEAREKGTEVHLTTEYYDYTGQVPDDLSEETVPYVQAYIQFIRDYAPKWEYIEHCMGSKLLGYCGTCDRAGVIDGEPCILDIKTSAKVNIPSLTAQLALYNCLLCEETDKYQDSKHYGLQLMRNGKYRLYDVPVSSDFADACLTISRGIESMKGKRYAV